MQVAGHDGAARALGMSTVAFTVCFAVWTIFAIIGIQLREELQLSEAQFGLLVGTPILTGSLIRILLGIWTDLYGGRLVFTLNMLAAAVATYLLTYATTYPALLLAALGVGIAGGSFSIGVAYVSRFFPPERQGIALGIFGAGNVGAAVTKLLAPLVLVAFGWHAVAEVWAAALAVMAVLFFVTTKDDPVIRQRRLSGERPKSALLELAPLRNVQVWRFSLYYFFVFGAFVALSLWLPQYLVRVYGLDIETAGVIAACFSIPASLFRAYGGHLSDTYGARRVLYWTFLVSIVATFILSYPAADYVIQGVHGDIRFHLGMGLVGFTVTVFILGFFMALGKAAVYKHIPVYYPNHVGAVGGLVGMIGGLGGFLLPILFGVLLDLTGLWTSCFMALFVIVAVSLIWMHFTIRQMERAAAGPVLAALPPFPEMLDMPRPVAAVAPSKAVLTDWRPEDETFWHATGRRIAQRNLWLSIPSLLLSFAIWQVWSVVVSKLPLVGFNPHHRPAVLAGGAARPVRRDLAHLLLLHGADFRRSSLDDADHMVAGHPGGGHRLCGPEPRDALCGAAHPRAMLRLRQGGNFASSMANISFFFPRAEKGNAMALNAGLGNLGVSVVQFRRSAGHHPWGCSASSAASRPW